MANKMLIDATHPEETRVVVLRGNRVEEFDFESAHRKQLRGNIYLAKVTRVEPSLQAAFVDYGGNRHGFLAFSEIHPDYYQIPVADRQALIDEEERAHRAADDEADRRSRRHRHHSEQPAARHDDVARSDASASPDNDAGNGTHAQPTGEEPFAATDGLEPQGEETHENARGETHGEADASAESAASDAEQISAAEISVSPDDGVLPMPWDTPAHESEEAAGYSSVPDATRDAPVAETAETASPSNEPGDAVASDEHIDAEDHAQENNAPREHGREDNGEDEESGEEIVESVGGADALEEVPDRAPRYRRQYKIQEVIKRRQVMLVQVVKEERGTKGAALTTYLSLAGRYSVLMPNTARGGGISRKITNAEDRARLKEIAQELEVPEGMGVILRTAGASRTKTEVKRDFEYLLRLWETVRDLTLKSTAPKLVYEEGSLVKRSIRDLYGREIDEIIVAGAAGYNEAKEFMRMLMPSHAKNVTPYTDTQPLLSRYGIENQLDAMFSPVVQLRSGGYIVLNQTEALVAIDVNSGRATREHHIEDTALKTNLEAADEIARQLRLRDLAGLIVIDFIDMDENRNNRSVERRLKECLKQDRARIQVGRISHFGLLEMSRQRIRASVLESSTEKCPYCGGSGHVRSVSSLALQVLRALEEQLIKGATHNLITRTRPDVALYVLNQKRAHLRGLEERFAITITIMSDETIAAPQAFAIDRGEQIHTVESARAIAEQNRAAAAPLEEDDNLEVTDAIEGVESDDEEISSPVAAPEQGEGGSRRRRRRRGRRGRGRDNGNSDNAHMHGHSYQPTHDAPAEPAGEFAQEIDDGMPGEGGIAEPHADSTQGGGGSPNEMRGERDGQAQPHRDGEHRRRRRGRRGGRRNRHNRNGEASHTPYDRPEDDAPQHAFAPGEESSSPPAAEPELRDAVRDLDAPPTRQESMPAEAAPPAASAAEQESPRRRSTVRERAPGIDGDDTPAPAAAQPSGPPPEPVITESSATEKDDKPRRTGWWSRRSAGG